MIKKIKLYFETKRLEKEMRFELLSTLYLFVDKKDKYIKLLHSLATEVDYSNFNRDLITKLAEFVHEDSKKAAEEEASE